MLPLTGLDEPYCYSLKEIVRANKSKENEVRENILLLARDRNGERVNECDNRQSCLLFPKWNRLSSLSSPLLTWQQFFKKKKRASEENSREAERGRESVLRWDKLSPHLSSHHFGGLQTQIKKPQLEDIDFILRLWLWPSMYSLLETRLIMSISLTSNYVYLELITLKQYKLILEECCNQYPNIFYKICWTS